MPFPLPSRKSLAKLVSARARGRRTLTRIGQGAASSALQGELVDTRRALASRSHELATTLAAMRATLESTADGILVTDAAGRVTAWNAKFLQLWGFAAADVEGATHAALVRRAGPLLRTPDIALRRLAAIEAAPPDGETWDRIELADGRVIECFSGAQQVDGHGVGRVWSYRDITARLQAEDALRDEAGVLHFLHVTGAAIAATMDIRVLMQTVVDAATQVSGAAFGAFFYRDGVADDADGVPLLAFAGVQLPPEESFDPLLTAALIGVAWRGGQTVRCADVTSETRYGDAAPFFGVAHDSTPLRSFLAVPVTLRDGVTIGGLFLGHPERDIFGERAERIVVGVAAHAAIALDNARLVEGLQRAAQERERLVAAERAAQAESARAAQMKDEFLSTLSHELRTPLTAILGWSKVLLLRRADEPTRQRGLEAIARNAGAQAALIEELLDMSRIVSGKVMLAVQAVDLAQVVDAAVAKTSPAAAAKQITLVRRIEPAACGLAGDAARLQQVVESLLSNAVKFTPAHGRIDVSVDLGGGVDAGEVEIAVADTGSGIAPEFLPHVFDRFRQADSSTRRSHGGLGLGLAIVRQLVALHGGAVAVTSGGVGQGARFVVRLPRGAAQAPVEAEPSTAPAAAIGEELRGLSVLVVDDDTDAREVIAQVLAGCGADVRQAASADDALRAFEQRPPAVLLSDIGMPGRDGYDLIRAVRARDAAHGGNVPAVALTAFARPEDRMQALLAGYQAHLAKPVQPDDLADVVAGLVAPRG